MKPPLRFRVCEMVGHRWTQHAVLPGEPTTAIYRCKRCKFFSHTRTMGGRATDLPPLRRYPSIDRFPVD